MITDISQLDLNKKYTYQDYLSWKFKERVELISGFIRKMSPAPSRKHQEISRNLIHFFDLFLWGKDCKLYHAPFDVRLSKEDQFTVVQPDLCVICDAEKLDDQGCLGAPDIIVEILSPGNSKSEQKDKFELYEKNLVPEYWLVQSSLDSIIVYHLNDHNEYIGSRPYVIGDLIESKVLPGLKVPVLEIFPK